MHKDVFLRSVFAGMVSAAVYALVELFAIRIGLQHTSVWEAAAGMFLPIDQVGTRLGTLIGLISHMAIGGLWGFIFYVLLLFIGVDRSALKGGLFGIYLWGFSAVMMREGVSSYVFFDANEQIAALFSSSLFGLALGVLIPRLTIQDISESNLGIRGVIATMIAQPAHKPTHDADDKNET